MLINLEKQELPQQHMLLAPGACKLIKKGNTAPKEMSVKIRALMKISSNYIGKEY